MVCTAFNQDALGLAAWTPLHSITLHGIHCIQAGCFWPCCIKSNAFNYSAGIHCIQSCCIIYTAFKIFHFFTMHGIHCIQSGCFGPCCKKSTAFNHVAGIHFIQSCCIKSTTFHRVPFLHAAWNTRHSITLHGIHCIQMACILPG